MVTDEQALDGHVHSWMIEMLWRDVRNVPCKWCGRTQRQLAALIARAAERAKGSRDE